MVLPESAAYVLEKLENAGFEAYVVGGCVRDALLGLEPKDYDVCTNALPEQTETAFAGERVIETGLIHGTVTVLIGGQPFEVTTYRVDGDYADHRHPDGVQFVRDLESDLQRRDFTVNAMAYSPRRGLRDPFGGQEDLKRRCIRCVGEAEKRFEEDALRILRALRFAAVYGFDIEKRTADAARARKDELQYVARERVTAELGKLLCGQAAEEIAFAFSDVLCAAMNVLPDAQGLNRVPPELPLRLAHVLRYAPQPERALNALRLDKETLRAVAELLAMRNRTAPQNDADVRRLLREAGCERALQLCRLKGWDTAPVECVLARGDCWNLKQLAVGGRDMQQLGLRGKEVGAMLNRLLDQVVEGTLPNDADALLKWAKQNG